jgi:hypothetical protein
MLEMFVGGVAGGRVEGVWEVWEKKWEGGA